MGLLNLIIKIIKHTLSNGDVYSKSIIFSIIPSLHLCMFTFVHFLFIFCSEETTSSSSSENEEEVDQEEGERGEDESEEEQVVVEEGSEDEE